jgi:FkbM family methyltransferase
MLELPWRRPIPGPFRPRRHGVHLTELDVEIPWGSHGFVLEGYGSASRARSLLGARYEVLGDLLQIDLDGMKVQLCSAEELFILDEIFIRTCYGWQPCQPTLVIDVGANVGLSCLYFARMDKVHRVVGFEPFLPTMRQAERNVGLNPGLGAKIELRPFGLGREDARLAVEYSFSHKGRVSPRGGLERVKTPITDRTVATIEIRDAAAAIDQILGSATGMEFALKLDCEGSEYEITSRLAEAGLLEQFRTIFGEWHGRRPGPLRDALDEAGFTVFTLGALEDTGLIYAAR